MIVIPNSPAPLDWHSSWHFCMDDVGTLRGMQTRLGLHSPPSCLPHTNPTLLTPTSTLMGLNRIPGGILIRGRLLRLKASRHIPSFIRGQQRGAGVSECWHGSVSAAFTATKHLQGGLPRYNVDQAAVVKGDYGPPEICQGKAEQVFDREYL